MADFSVRRITAAQAELLAASAALSTACFPDQSAQQWQVSQLADHLSQNDNALFGGFVRERLVAFGLFTLIAGEGELLSLCSDPVCRRAGYAKALLTHSVQVLNPEKLMLEVAADNLAAIRLYQRLGFRETDRRKAYYAAANGPPKDAIVMGLLRAK